MYSAVPGSVGIGTAMPAAKLDVNGNINVDSLYQIQGQVVLSTPRAANTFVGNQAGKSNTSGGLMNTFVGGWAGHSNTGGDYNTFLGENTGYLNTTGVRNTFVGAGADYRATAGNYNTYLG